MGVSNLMWLWFLSALVASLTGVSFRKNILF